VKTQASFSKEAKKISMTAREREILREKLISYMEYHPLRMPLSQKHVRSVGQYTRLITFFYTARTFRLRRIAGTFALLFFITIPVFAEQALPGDTLYLVKVRFNEGIRSQLAFSPYEKMQWETTRIERRIAEARLLVKEGKLTEEKENTLEESIRSHTSAFQEQLAELRESDATGAAVAEVTLESALDVQSAVLNTEIAQEASATSPNEGSVSGIAAIVREARSEVVSSTDDTNGIVSYEPLSARVEENTTRIQALSQSLENELTEPQKSEIEERMTQVDADIVAAEKVHDAGDNDAAMALLRNALGTTEKLIAFMSSIDLRANVSLDALVPQQTPDEVRKAALEKTLASYAEKYATFGVASSILAEPQKTEVAKQLEILSGLLEKSNNEITKGNLTEAEQAATDAGASISILENLKQH
jgi:hypothetical protein